MEGCDASWLRTVLATLRRYKALPGTTIDELGAELSHLAWSDDAPTASTLSGDRGRFRRHPIAGSKEIDCSALLMYWPAGHATLPHDHGGYWGIDVVLDGTLYVEEFVRSGSQDAPALVKTCCKYLGIGDVALFDSNRYVHRCRNLSNAAPALTLNVYGGPLGQYVSYEQQSSGVVTARSQLAVCDAILD